MFEKMDFGTEEGQDAFDELSGSRQEAIVREAQKEALKLERLRNEIIELTRGAGRELSPEEVEQIRAKELRLFEDPNVIVHSTRHESLPDILTQGLLGYQTGRSRGLDMRLGRGNYSNRLHNSFDIISVTARHPGDATENIVRSTALGALSPSGVSLIYDERDIVEGSFLGAGPEGNEYVISKELPAEKLKGIAISNQLFTLKLGDPLLEQAPDAAYWKMLKDLLGAETTYGDCITSMAANLKVPVYAIHADAVPPGDVEAFQKSFHGYNNMGYQVVSPEKGEMIQAKEEIINDETWRGEHDREERIAYQKALERDGRPPY